MAKTIKRLSGPTLVSSATPVTLFTVPSGHRYIVTQVHVLNTNSSTNGLAASVGALSGTSELFNGGSPILAASGGYFDWTAYPGLAFEAAEIMQAQTTTGNSNWFVMGYDEVI